MKPQLFIIDIIELQVAKAPPILINIKLTKI